MEDRSTLIIGLAGALLTLLFAYVPGFTNLFAKWDSNPNGKQYKQLVMLGLIVATTLILYGLSCYSPWVIYDCSGSGAWDVLFDLAVAIAINQGLYKGTKYVGHGAPAG